MYRPYQSILRHTGICLGLQCDCVSARAREREREILSRERERDRQTERERESENHRERKRERERSLLRAEGYRKVPKRQSLEQSSSELSFYGLLSPLPPSSWLPANSPPLEANIHSPLLVIADYFMAVGYSSTRSNRSGAGGLEARGI